MKKILTINLILAFLFSPANSLLAVGSSASPVNVFRSYSSNKTQTSSSATAQIQVVSAPVYNQGTVTLKTVSSPCKTNLSASDQEIVQSTAAVNLNQPANCFTLSLSAAAPVTAHLVVATKAASQNVIVVSEPQILSHGDFAPAPFSSTSLPVIPASFFVLAVGLFVFRKKLIDTAVAVEAAASFKLQPQTVLVLRC